jgi:ABC-type cobalamin/Fe3+-siderophores transport system ATPase subunit
MTFNLNFPLSNGEEFSFSIGIGEVLFVLGANGTGKSSLLQRFYTTHRNIARRISAHRQTWFESNAMTLSAQQKKEHRDQYAEC